MTKKQLNAIQTIKDLQEIVRVDYEIGYRGGSLGIPAGQVASLLGIEEHLLPGKIGVYVNYLGGGLRGGLARSTFSSHITGRKKEHLELLIDACERAYINAENEIGLNEVEDEDGETNWDAIGTNAVRNAGIVSAY